MNRQRPTWWMYVITASYLALVSVIYYLVIWGPSDIEGYQPTFGQGAMRIQSVTPGGVLATAGLRAGDIVRTVDGLPIRTARDWAAVQFNLEVGKPQNWQILRGDERLGLQFTPERATWGNRLANGYVLYVSLSLACFPLGLFIAFRRPGDPAARVGSWFITTASMAFGLPNGWAALWRQMPLLVQALLWIPEVSRFLIEGIFVSLFALFPCRLFRARWPWFVVWIPVVSTLPWRVSEVYSIVYRPGHAPSVPQWLLPATSLRIMLYLITGVVLLAVSYRRLAGLNERRRVRVMVSGTAIGLLAAIPIVRMNTYWTAPTFAAFVFFPFTLACPLAFAYAILRHRVFDIQVIIRQGLQYALARGAVLGVVPVLGAILLLDLAINRRQPLADILQARGWIYAGLGGLALLAYWQRKSWLETLDCCLHVS